MSQGSSKVQLFTFSPGFGLPTSGPFGLKLAACLRMLDIPFELVFEDNNRKGPKRKSPWIVDGDLRMGDTELILQHFKETRGVELDAGLSPYDRARGLAIRRMLEEHFHQVFEYELFVLDAGWQTLVSNLRGTLPGPVLALVGPLIRRSFKKHLFERGIARHSPAEVEAMGRADVDALAELLGKQEWFLGAEPTKTDASAFGLLAVAICSNMPTPMCSYARTQDNLVAYVDRAQARFFPQTESSAPPIANAANG